MTFPMSRRLRRTGAMVLARGSALALPARIAALAAPARIAALALPAWIAALAAPALAGTWSAFERLPDAAPITVQVSGKPRTYFRITSQSPVVVPVEGPARLRVTSRVELPIGAKTVVTYRILATEAGHTIEELSTETSAGGEAKAAGIALGKSRKMTFDVPAGAHRITLSVAGASAALVRIQQSGAAAGEAAPTVSLTPVSASRSVSVSEGEKIIPYYSVLHGQPVRVRVVGPTTLELLTRLDFDATMRGAVPCRLRIVEGGRTLREVAFRATKATTATYTNLPDRVPSKFDRVSLPIGDGLHEIAIELLEPIHGAAEIHARIPQPAVGNEE